ncbi:MAG: hypothetical protein J9259_05565 [Thermoplasmata archaeon YP2-bin.285]|uniref:Uncharacterized protein n=1 Tax=Candidatus Sysuiplasma superficiale TaxID=2823368 RepID=A0A8J7YNJ5_9ARCH|nr:hypothetical protein [Candidatus Sysuiplasma superficiale]
MHGRFNLKGRAVLNRGDKKIHVRIEKGSKLTLKDVLKKIKEIQAANPDLDVFFDGDEYAICSRPLKKDSTAAEVGHRSRK